MNAIAMNRPEKINTPKRMDIYYVDLRGGSAGSEQSGIRPCLILQNNIGNRFSPTTIIVPFSTASAKAKIPTHISVRNEESGLPFDSILLFEQIRVVDEYKLMDRVGRITDEVKIREIENALLISVGIDYKL
ncbi:mRNA interferase EndoA [compost metagenome]